MLRLPPLNVNGEIQRLPLEEAEAVRLYVVLPHATGKDFPSLGEWNRLLGGNDADAGANLLARADELSWEPDGDETTPPPFAALFLAALQKLKHLAAAVEDAKLKALYHFAYGMSHEFNNPLANIATRAQTLLRDETDPDRRRKLATINAQAFRGHEMLADLMLFAKPPALELADCNLTALVQTTLAESAVDAREQGSSLRSEIAEEITLRGDKNQLLAVLRALVRNALESLRTGGEIALTIRSEANFAVIEVRDDGPGISAAIRPLIFNPFFSGREAGRGLGNGLAKCWKVVEMHGGTIAIDSPATGGATVQIRLPR